MIGWFVSMKTTRRLDNERRRERITDVQTALLAEIRAAAHALGQYDNREVMAGVRERLRAKGKSGYVPFVPREPGSPVFRAVVGEISILPTEVIDAVVLFYNQQQVIEHFAEDLRGERFSQLQVEQQMQMLEDFLALKTYAFTLADQAASTLRASLGINKSDAGPSVP